jgi:hypothetical protein
VVKRLVGFITATITNFATITEASLRFSYPDAASRHLLCTPSELVAAVVSELGRQGAYQAARAIGYSDMLGNPLGLIGRMGTGLARLANASEGFFETGDAQVRRFFVLPLSLSLFSPHSQASPSDWPLE